MANEFTPIAEEAVDLAQEEVSEEVQSEINADLETARIAAKDLLDYVKDLMIKRSRGQNRENLQKSINDASGTKNPYSWVKQFSSKYVKKNDYLKLMEKVLSLQNAANTALGQTVQMIYVYEDENGNVEIYKFDNSIAELTKRGKIKNINTLINLGVAEKMEAENLEIEKNLNEAYRRVSDRYQKALAFNKVPGSVAAYIMWKMQSEWVIYRIGSAGPLKEAYFNFYINEFDFKEALSNSVDQNETDINEYMLNNDYGVVAADNTPGFLQGDVSRNGIEYAVKSNSASAMGYLKIVQDWALEIYQATSIEQIKQLKDRLNNEYKTPLIKKVGKKVEGTFEDIISPLEEANLKNFNKRKGQKNNKRK